MRKIILATFLLAPPLALAVGVLRDSGTGRAVFVLDSDCSAYTNTAAVTCIDQSTAAVAMRGTMEKNTLAISADGATATLTPAAAKIISPTVVTTDASSSDAPTP